jgi:hypothetical protein
MSRNRVKGTLSSQNTWRTLIQVSLCGSVYMATIFRTGGLQLPDGSPKRHRYTWMVIMNAVSLATSSPHPVLCPKTALWLGMDADAAGGETSSV